MKTLLLMRHAESDPANGELEDHDRPINHQGKLDAVKIGKLLQTEDLVPERILSSTARRARQTAVGVADASECDGDIDYLPELYKTSVDDLMAVIQSIPEELSRVMLVGHNPELGDLVSELAGLLKDVPPGSLAHFSLAVDEWVLVNLHHSGGLVNLWRPHELV